MKLGKLSLVAVMALGTSAFAIDNVKVNGEAKLWYQTSEVSTAPANDFFDNKTNSLAEVKLSVGATADLLQNLSAGIKVTALSTLGLENNLVGGVPAATDEIDGDAAASPLDDQSWVEELYLAYTMGKTTAKVGRQALSTPLAFTESWNVVDNTFEAAVLLNNDLPDTTLVAAWVGNHNGTGMITKKAGVTEVGSGRGKTVSNNGKFGTFALDGAYAAGAINKSIPNTTVQAWYYNVDNVADAYWLQADAKIMDIVNVGVQYAGMNPDKTSRDLTAASSQRDTDMFAVKAAVDVAGVNVYAAYSTVSDGTLGFANVATGDKSSMYTTLGSIYMDGEIVAAPDTDAWKVGASTKMIPGVTLSASYCEAETGNNGGVDAVSAIAANGPRNTDYSAWDVVAAGNVGPLGLTAIYTQYEKDLNTGTDVDTDTIRFIASLKF